MRNTGMNNHNEQAIYSDNHHENRRPEIVKLHEQTSPHWPKALVNQPLFKQDLKPLHSREHSAGKLIIFVSERSLANKIYCSMDNVYSALKRKISHYGTHTK